MTLPRALRGVGPIDLVKTITHAPLGSSTPYVLTVGDLSFLHHPDQYPRGARLRLNTLVPRQARRARLVVTPSEFSRRDVVDSYGIDPERVMVVPNRVSSFVPLDPAARARAELELKHAGVDQPFVGYLGNLHPRKNVPALIHAFGRARQLDPAIAELQLVIAGGTWWKGGAEAQAVRDARLDSVVLLGPVGDDVRRLLLEDAIALGYLSRFEGFGLPPLEAMAAGTPVLASDATAIPEVCGDAALLVDPEDLDAIAHGLVRIATDSALRARLVTAGRARAQHFDAHNTGAAECAALRRALDGAAAPFPGRQP